MQNIRLKWNKKHIFVLCFLTPYCPTSSNWAIWGSCKEQGTCRGQINFLFDSIYEESRKIASEEVGLFDSIWFDLEKTPIWDKPFLVTPYWINFRPSAFDKISDRLQILFSVKKSFFCKKRYQWRIIFMLMIFDINCLSLP